MRGKSFFVDLNPSVLRWARESAGYSLDEASVRCGKSADQLAAWESGRRRPKWSVVCKLATTYKRPVAALLLPRPPDEAPPPPDFRKLPQGQGSLSPRTLFVIRTARWLGHKAAELEEQVEAKECVTDRQITIGDDPDEAATQTRASLGITIAEQAEFPDVWQALKRWRAAVEGRNVFVFQFTMPVEEARGFSLKESGRPLIVLNQSDSPSARIFTLFHEYAHLLLSRPGICLPDEALHASARSIETFCNRFAAALLVPRADVQGRLPHFVNDEALRNLARRYRVSRYVVLGRLHDLDVVSAQTYREISRRWQRLDQSSALRRPQGGGLNGRRRCLLERGNPFVSLIIQAVKRELITVNDATTYLGTSLKDYLQLAKDA